MNRTVLFFIIVFSFIGNQAIARIGETPKQCLKRYGKPYSTKVFPDIKEVWNWYLKGGFDIRIFFYDGKAGVISFSKLGTSKELSENEIQTLLRANGGKRIWIKSEALSLTEDWTTEDYDLSATYTPEHSLVITLIISTREWRERQIEEIQALEDNKLKDF